MRLPLPAGPTIFQEESVRRFHICKTIRNQHFHPITPPPRRHSLHCTAALHCTPPRFISGSCALPCHGVHLPIVVRWTPPHLTEAQVVLDDSNTFIPSEQHEINNGIIQSILRHPCRSGGRHAGIPLWERGGVAAAAQSRNLYIAKKSVGYRPPPPTSIRPTNWGGAPAGRHPAGRRPAATS